MPIDIFREVGILLEWADGFVSKKKWDWVTGGGWSGHPLLRLL